MKLPDASNILHALPVTMPKPNKRIVLVIIKPAMTILAANSAERQAIIKLPPDAKVAPTEYMGPLRIIMASASLTYWAW